MSNIHFIAYYQLNEYNHDRLCRSRFKALSVLSLSLYLQFSPSSVPIQIFNDVDLWLRISFLDERATKEANWDLIQTDVESGLIGLRICFNASDIANIISTLIAFQKVIKKLYTYIYK